jgi:probable F420-dependent oxidoreductase
MKFGLCLPNFPFGVQPSREAIVEVAQEAERLGYDSVWTTDHILPPAAWPRFGHLYETLSTLAYLGGATETIRLGTSILVLPYRNAITVAKQTATIDALTGGRMIIGVGVGHLEAEFQSMGVDFRSRGRRLDEQLRVLRTLWMEDDPRFDGEFYRFSDVLFEPRPAQEGGIPLWVGGNSDRALSRAARLGDAWHADDLRPEQLRASQDKLQEMSNGRQVGVTLRRTVDLRPALDAARSGTPAREATGEEFAITGTLQQALDEIAAVAEVGVEHFVCQFEHATQEEHLQQMAYFAQEVFPHVNR